MALAPLITAAQLELRLTPAIYARVFNDYNLGTLNGAAEQQLREDASSKVRGALGNVYDVDALVITNEVFAGELRRITLDVAHALCAQRNPSIVPIDGFAMMKQADDELGNLRGGRTTLVSGDGTLPPGAVQGGGSGRVTAPQMRPAYSFGWDDFGGDGNS